MAEGSGGSSGGHGGGQTAPKTGGGASNPALFAMFATRKLMTDRQLKIYAASLCGLIAIFILFHWIRLLSIRVERKLNAGQRPILGRPFVSTSRVVRNILVRKFPGFTSNGHALLVTTYVVMNIAITFTYLDMSSMTNFAARFGWMGLANMAFVIFLALKNTPLAFLTAYSYERLNCLHQVAGYTVFISIVLHAALYTAYFGSQGKLATKYADENMIGGIVAGFSLLGVVFSATFLRRVWYEVFYVVHIASWISLIVSTGFHQPDFGKGLIITLLAASMWFSDRIIRATRLAYNSINNEATLHALPDGGTKIVMKKVLARAEAGKHCFVWIPAIRKFETHPFTIHGTSPVEFTVQAHNGFTRDLHQYAVDHPGAKVKASVDGPYGTFPDPMEFDKIVLIAGGGGATFTFGLAVNILERMKDEAHKHVVFIWAVKKHENLSWFKEQLEYLKTHAHSPKVDVSLFVTRSPASLTGTSQPNGESSSQSSLGGSPPLSPTDDVEKDAARQLPLPSEKDIEKEMQHVIETRVEHHGAADKEDGGATTSTATVSHHHPVKAGRPDVTSLIHTAITSTPSNQRVLVAACGPDGLMHIVRDTTARLIRGDGPGVELHCEQFGW